jgi:hypothetical protein
MSPNKDMGETVPSARHQPLRVTSPNTETIRFERARGTDAGLDNRSGRSAVTLASSPRVCAV